MSQAGKTYSGAIAFEQLIALNDEMAALVRAGIPLEEGLTALGRDLPGRPGRLAETLARRMIAGESLPQILGSEPKAFPPVWRAVVEAGLRSGQLAAALESMSAAAGRMAQLRKTVGAALIYPLVVLALAYLMFLFTVMRLAPVTSRAYLDLTNRTDPFVTGLAGLGDTILWWGPTVPLIAAVLIGLWWRWSGRAAWSQRRFGKRAGYRRWFSLGLDIRAVLWEERLAAFTEILALLVKHEVPLAQALNLSAEASGDAALQRASQEIVARLERGEVSLRREDLPAGFPPVLGWLLASRAQPAMLSEVLSHTAATYRDRAAHAGVRTAFYLPIVMTVLVGGTATFCYGLVTFLPLWRLWYALGMPV